MEAQYQSPLPMDPSTPQRPEVRPRSKSSFSFRSQKSDKSSGSKAKLDLIESESEKRRAKFSGATTANPNRAINEDQPAVRAQSERATLLPLRSIQHIDATTGAVITDPDASNPSRSRLERPLDTIRAFHAAADAKERAEEKRNQPARTESADALTAYSSRRSSVIGGFEGQYPTNNNPRYAAPYNAYDGPRRASYGRPNYDYGRGPPNSYPRRPIGQRMVSAPLAGRGAPEHAQSMHHAYQESYDTTYTGESSQSEPWANSTDPSSENSSLDRIHAIKNGEHSGDAYGGQYNQGLPLKGPITEEGHHAGPAYQGRSYSNGSPSPNPASQYGGQGRYPLSQQRRQQSPGPGRPFIKLGSDQARPVQPQGAPYGQQGPAQQYQNLPPSERPPPNTYDSRRQKLEKKAAAAPPVEKRKSWLKRTFSSNKK